MIVDNNLYKASVSGPPLWCLSKTEGQELLPEVHAGIYGGHIGALALAAKVLAPLQDPNTVFAANRSILATTAVGHRHHWQAHSSTRQLHFRHCGNGIFHEMSRGKARHQHNLRDNQNFFWQNIICRYRLPQQTTVENTKYFHIDMFKDFCHHVGMKVAFTSEYHL
jgi:hypothetical protein